MCLVKIIPSVTEGTCVVMTDESPLDVSELVKRGTLVCVGTLGREGQDLPLIQLVGKLDRVDAEMVNESPIGYDCRLVGVGWIEPPITHWSIAPGWSECPKGLVDRVKERVG
jgi:hypothetical protein